MYTEFFLICLSNDNLYNYYQVNFALMQHHKYSFEDLENMFPFEREVYTAMLMSYLEEEKSRLMERNR